MVDIQNTVKAFIVDNFLFGSDEGLKEDTSFLEEGIIDSTGVLELITFLEDKFDIKVNDDELIPENLDTLNRINKFLRHKFGKTKQTDMAE